jgi:hypothetical protein
MVLSKHNLHVINIVYQGRYSILSNLAHTPFTVDQLKFASVEAFVQSIKWPEGPKRERIQLLWGFEAQRAGNNINKQIRRMLSEGQRKACVYWGGRSIEYRSGEHLSLIERAIRAKFETHSEARDCLKTTGDVPLAHEMGKKERPTTSLPAAEFCLIMNSIREELQSLDRINRGKATTEDKATNHSCYATGDVAVSATSLVRSEKECQALSNRERAQQRARELGNDPMSTGSRDIIYSPLQIMVFEKDGVIYATLTSCEGVEQFTYNPIPGDSGYLVESTFLDPNGNTTHEEQYLDVSQLPTYIITALQQIIRKRSRYENQ